MAEDTADTELNEDGEPKQKKVSGKRLIIFAVAILLVLVGGGVGAAFMLGVFSEPEPAPTEEGAAPVQETAVEQVSRVFFYEVPDLIVNLNTDGRKSTFLKIKVQLELNSADDVDTIEELLPRIVDNFQIYLRELRTADLNGSAGIYRLKEELLRRVNLSVRQSGVQVRDVLFKEMLVQ